MKFRLPMPALAAALVLMLGSAHEATAAFAAALEVVGPSGTTQNYVLDNGIADGFIAPAGYVELVDVDARPGFISVGDIEPLSGFRIEGSLQTATFASGAPGSLNRLDTSSLQITNDTGGEVTAKLAVSATGFVGPVVEAFAAGSVVWEDALGAALVDTFYNDPANGQGAEGVDDAPGTPVYAVAFESMGLADADAASSGPVAVDDPALFSMTLTTTLITTDTDSTANNGVFARVVNNGSAEVKPVVPEPPAFVLGLIGLVGLGARRRLRREQLRRGGSLIHLG